MEKQGTVISVENGMAKVLVYRESACEGCHKRCDGKCAEAKPMEILVENELGAVKGDTVTLYTADKEINASAVLLYLMPVVFAVIAATIVSEFAGMVTVAIVFFAVVAICFAIVIALSKIMKNRGLLQIKMINIESKCDKESSEQKND